jgi:uroporphyrinogen-III synthase
MTRVIVLRPEPGATATVERARELGLDAVAIPLFQIEPVAWHAPDPRGFDALLLTSANAVRVAGAELGLLRALPVHAVGDATAAAAREAGFEIASSGSASVDQLLDGLCSDMKLLHLCGAHRRIPQRTRQAITPLVVYQSLQRPTVDVHEADSAVALIHSPRAARRFAELVDDRSSIAVAAISIATAEAAGAGWRSVAIAERPSDEALLATAASLCNKPPPQ